MKAALTPDVQELVNAVPDLPSVSIIIPFEPAMSAKTVIQTALEDAFNEVENKLLSNYTSEKAKPVLQKLQTVIEHLDYNNHKKSIVIYVSPSVEKMLYLDIEVDKKITIDELFEIRDVVYSKKQWQRYLLLILSANSTKIYLGNSLQFMRIISNLPNTIDAYENDISERVANFSHPSRRKEIMVDKFLKHTDNGLSILLQSYPLPLFVFGTRRTIGHFKKITHNKSHIIDYIHGNFEEASCADINKVIQPYIEDWENVKQQDLLNQLDRAISSKKLAVGIKEVWKVATQRNGRRLLVEKNYMYPAQLGDCKEIIYKAGASGYQTLHIKDAVDNVIEKVLLNGGDIEFVDKDFLIDYGHIALIQYYSQINQ